MARRNRELIQHLSNTLNKAKSDIIHGSHPFHIGFGGVDNHPPSLVGTGASVFLDQNHANSVTPDTRNIIAMSPDATILVKKKAFSSLKSSNDLRFMDKTEKMLLRATKTLFAYKVQQIRAYESLTKFENFFSDNSMYSMNLLSSFMKEGSLLDIEKLGFTAEEYAAKKLEEWLNEDMDKYMQTDDGTFVTYDAATGEPMAASVSFPVQSSSAAAVPPPPSVMLMGRESITNREYVNSLPASQAKALLGNKKIEFKAEYEGVDGHAATVGEASKDLTVSKETFFDDVADLMSFGASAQQYDAMNEDIAKILRRNAFSVDNQLTTWIVDPDSPANYTLGPGTGVIEVAVFNSFTTAISHESGPSSANFSLSYPYRIGTVLEDDIEVAIEDALHGTVGILDELLSGGLRSEGMSGPMPPIDGASIVSAAMELGGLGSADSSMDTDYIRDRLRTFYLGKPFINPPDPVHFYIRGNRTFTDYTSVGKAYPEEASEAPFDTEYLQLDNVILKAEYLLYTNQAIPFEIFKEDQGNTVLSSGYKAMRRLQHNSFGMIHVFGGYVESTSETFGGGYWTLKVSCTDNMSWLKWSRFAIQPALSDPKNILEDPLTPFELVKDELGQPVGTERELLYENKQLLQTGLLNYDSGLLAGQNVTEGNLLQGQYNGVGSLGGKKVLQHPDGFIYRWKTGIITATAGFQVNDPTGESQRSPQFDQQYAVTVTKNVLNNLDIPNILSILIVGQPYNIETFIEQSFNAHNKDDRSANLSPTDPLAGVVEALRSQNEYYGNFHPYRMLSVSSASAEQMINQAGVREISNHNIKNMQKRKVKLRSKIRDLNKSIEKGGDEGLPVAAIIATLQAEIDTIDAGIQEQIRVATKANSALTSADQVGIQISLFGASSGLPETGEEEENHDVTRAMMHVGAQRRIEDVRLNRDRNLFIVSDQYDMADIRPFILNLNQSGWKLFDGTYSDVWQQCNAASNMLHLEFFCNSQGHLEFRPPLWNRVPLTVLKGIINVQEETGAAIMPTFITNLFQTRIEGLYTEIHTLNVKIVLLSLLMGRFPDAYLIPNMSLSGKSSLKFFGIQVGGVKSAGNTGDLSLVQTEFTSILGGLTEQNNSLFGTGLQLTASFQDKGDVLGGDTETLLGTFDPIFQEGKSLIDDIQTVLENAGTAGGGREPGAIEIANADSLNGIRNSFKRQFGRDPATGLGIDARSGFKDTDFIFHPENKDRIDTVVMGRTGILTKLKKAISDRDSYVSMLQANLAKQEELEEIENFLSEGEESDETSVSEGFLSGPVTDWMEKLATSMQTASDIITGKAAEGTVYDHLIEDDTRNFLGYGSGKRFILKDEHIVNATFSETPPSFTRVSVKGDAPLGMGDGLNAGTDGLYFWAGATDFDLWRQYGYRPADISLPFVSDVEGQARPYAILELTMQKMSINKADVTIVGNEFYQPGDTVYVPTKGLLYYVKSVSHNFSYSGQSFTTSLSLNYGHPPGQYVASPLDVIGQQLVSNFLEDPALIYRTQSTDDNYRVLKPDSTLVFPTGGAGMAELLAHSDNQLRFTNMMMDLTGSLSGTRFILIRGFVKDSEDVEHVQSVSEKLAVVRSLLENPSQVSQSHPYSGGDDIVEGFAQAITSVGSLFGGSSVGTTKNLTKMRLPNNMPVTPITSSKIIEQITYLKRTDDTNPLGKIKCLDRRLAAVLYEAGQVGAGEVTEASALGIFPKGGPRQGSWLDFRDEISGANFTGEINVIEVGIIDIPNNVLSSVI